MKCLICNSDAKVQIPFAENYQELTGKLPEYRLKAFCFHCLQRLSDAYNQMLQKGVIK